MDLSPYIARFEQRYAEVQMALSDPKVFNNPARAQELSREFSRLRDLVGVSQEYLRTLKELADNRAMLNDEAPESEMAVMLKEEIQRLEGADKKLEIQVQAGIVPPDPSDSRNTIVEIRAGAGGNESALFAADL